MPQSVADMYLHEGFINPTCLEDQEVACGITID